MELERNPPIRFSIPSNGSDFSHPALGAVLVMLIGGAVLAPCLGFGFVYYDDYPILIGLNAYLSNPWNLVATFSHDGFARMGPEMAGLFYRPILLDSFILDALIGGARPAVFHAMNLGIHLTSAGLVFLLLFRLSGRWQFSVFLALVYCIHPVLVSVPAWLSGRNDSLLAIFAVLHVLFLVEYLKRGRGVLLFPVLATLALALFTKETAVVLAGLVPAFVWVERRQNPIPFSRLLALAGGVIGVVLVWAIARRFALGETTLILSGRGVNIPMLFVYLGKVFFPIQLSPYPSIKDVSLAPGFIAGGLIAVGMFFARRQLLGRAGLGLLWYAAFMAPTLLASPKTTGLEHRLCVPLIGLLVSAAVLLEGRVRRMPPWLAWGTALAILVALGSMTLRRLPEYSDDIHFWESASRSSPQVPRIWENLGMRYLAHNRMSDVEAAANTLIGMQPKEAVGHVMLGVSLARQGQLGAAEARLRRGLELDPEHLGAWGNLAKLLRLQGRTREAKEAEGRIKALRAGLPPTR